MSATLQFAGTTLWSDSSDVGRLELVGWACASSGIVSRHLPFARGNFAKDFGAGSGAAGFACMKKFSSQSAFGSFVATCDGLSRDGLGTLVAGNEGTFTNCRIISAAPGGPLTPAIIGGSTVFLQVWQFLFERMTP